jgi:hypothetical protein
VWVAPGARSGVPPTVGPVEFSPSHGVRPTVFLYRNCCYSSEAEHATRNGGVVGCCRRECRCRRQIRYSGGGDGAKGVVAAA